MKILVVSNTPWNTDNSFGNSYSNIFDGIDNLEFANIYCRYGNANFPMVKRSFQITEKSLLKNIFYKDIPSGEEKEVTQNITNDEEPEIYNFARKRRYIIYSWARDIIWKIGHWKSKELESFISEFKPDLIFQPVYFSSYINDIVRYVKKYTNVPMIGYISDDCYTLRQINFSPFYWIDRLYKRKKVKRTIEQCELLYVISQIQKEEYEKIFTPECKILTKCSDFTGDMPKWELPKDEIKLIYAGNLSEGRQKSLHILADAVERLNKDGFLIKLDIYSSTPLTEKSHLKLTRKGCRLHSAVSYKEIQQIQNEADILIHVEGLSLKDRYKVHQSFSTKLVDFFEKGKCIFAIGTYDMGSVRHLVDNDAAIVAENSEEVYSKLKKLVENKDLILEYGKKAWECGKKHHEKKVTQAMLMDDIRKVVGSENEGIAN